MGLKGIKRKLGLIVQHSRLLRGIATDINLALFHWDERERDRRFGDLNPEVRFYVLRSSGTDEGLLSLYLGHLTKISQAKAEGFVPVVDWENSRTQYSVDFPVNGTHNAWEYYFEQPCRFSLDEVFRSRNVRLSGWRFFQKYGRNVVRHKATPEMMSNAPVKQYIHDIARKRITADGINGMVGVLVRGTDYTRLRPAGHPVSPSPEQAAEKLDEFFARHGQSRIFLATEDEGIYTFFRQKYGELIYTTDNNIIRGYSGKDYIASAIDAKDRYQFGLDYLVKMICLSECRSLIASRTAGTEFALLLNGGRYQYSHVFDLGTY